MNDSTKKRPLLILDLDETLIFGSERELDRPCDFRVGPFFVYERPYLGSFLDSTNEHFDLAIWSSATDGYVAGIASHLTKQQGVEWIFVWSRHKCVQRMDMEWLDTIYIKDLKKLKRLGYPKERILIVDDTRRKVSRNYGNAIYPSPFEGDINDDELKRLEKYLIRINGEPNYRKLEKRGWRNQT